MKYRKPYSTEITDAPQDHKTYVRCTGCRALSTVGEPTLERRQSVAVGGVHWVWMPEPAGVKPTGFSVCWELGPNGMPVREAHWEEVEVRIG